MALAAAEIDHLRALVARSGRHLSRVRAYHLTCLRLGVRLPDRDEGEEQDHEDDDYYPELRCHNGEYYYHGGQEGSEDDAVAWIWSAGSASSRMDKIGMQVNLPWRKRKAPLYADEASLDLSGQETSGFCANKELHEEAGKNADATLLDSPRLSPRPCCLRKGGQLHRGLTSKRS